MYDTLRNSRNTLCSTSVLNRCVPQIVNDLVSRSVVEIIAQLNHINWLKVALTDIVTFWREVVALCAFSLGNLHELLAHVASCSNFIRVQLSPL